MSLRSEVATGHGESLLFLYMQNEITCITGVELIVRVQGHDAVTAGASTSYGIVSLISDSCKVGIKVKVRMVP
jgi:hypothetical protein